MKAASKWSRKRNNRRPSPYRLRLEPLESRMLLATFVVNSTQDLSDDNPGDGICQTSSSGGVCTLRAAIQEVNAFSDGGAADTINFGIPGAGPHTISPASALPPITQTVTIDGYTQPGASANTNPVGQGLNSVLKIELNGGNAPAGANGLKITAGGSTVRGLAIYGFRGLQNPANSVIEGGAGIALDAIGNNSISGNFVGTDAQGVTDPGDPNLNEQVGVLITSSSNTIGGILPADRNLISGNTGGISVRAGTANRVHGNLIGTNVTGTAAAGNSAGIAYSAAGNTVGGTAVAMRNVISGNIYGIILSFNGGANSVVQGNFIGTDVTGTLALGNLAHGIDIDSPNNTIGGTAAGAGNVISGNSANGITIDQEVATGNVVQGNLIGTNAAGTAAVGNANHGINGAPAGTQIGGVGAGNTISGNLFDGINLAQGANGAIVQGNRIGTDITGAAAIPNGRSGIELFFRFSNATIGGAAAGQANLIANNRLNGVQIGFECTGNRVEGNTIAANGRDGVLVATVTGTGNSILGNSMFSNTSLGINLLGPSDPASGVTANDANDPDTGANNLQNFPVIVSAAPNGAALSLTYSVPSDPANSMYPLRVEFFIADASGAEGQIFIGFDTYTAADFAAGNKTIVLNPLSPVALGKRIVSTATDSKVLTQPGVIGPADATQFDPNNTSEFSLPAIVRSASPLVCEVITQNSPGRNGTAILGPDADNPAQNALIITGTLQGDAIVVEPRPNDLSQIRVIISNKAFTQTFFFPSSAVQHFVIFGLQGNDKIAVNPLLLQPATIFGGSGDDVIVGGGGPDQIDGQNGGDKLNGALGDDTVCGGNGNDIVRGGLGNDVLGGDAGNDVLAGSLGNDLLLGSTGNDVLDGGADNDRLFGQSGKDKLVGAEGDDILVGGDGDDTLVGGVGRGIVIGGRGKDIVVGNAFDDIVIAGSTDHDTDDAALQAILDEWLSIKSYSDRVSNIRNGGGANGAFVLDDTTVFDDGVKDTLIGDGGIDWFWIGTKDRIKDRLQNEQVN